MLHAYETPPAFVSNVDMPLGEGDLDILTSNAILLDALSFRATEPMNSSAGKDTSTPNAYTGLATEIIWRGSFLMVAGATDLDIEGWAQKGATEDFQLFLNGAGISTTAVPNGAPFALNADISALTVGAVYEAIIQISGVRNAAQALAAKYVIYDAYVSPISVGAAWSGVPTFAGTYSALLLNQLGNAQRYVAARLNAIPALPFLASYYAHGSSVTADVYPLWWGAVERANAAAVLNIRIVPMLPADGNVAEFYRIKVGGSTVHTGATMTAGQTRDDYLALDLSGFSADTRLETVIETVITTGPVAGASGDRNSRYHLWTARLSNASPATAAAPTDFTAGESLASTTVDSRLNALCSMVSAAYTRINANPRIFNRVRLMRRMFGRDSGQYAVFAPNNTYAQRFVRRGARLIVHGKGLNVGWGAISTTAEKTVTTAYKVDFAHSEPLTDGDAYQTKTIYLDSLPYLRRGQAYSVFGDDVVLAQEMLL